METPRKTKLAALALLGLTLGAVLYYPQLESAEPVHRPLVPTASPAPDPSPVADVGQHPAIEAVFVLDTTGSMGGLIQAAKDKIWSIASTMASAQPAPEIRMGLVAYRDRGDDYVTRVVGLSQDLDRVYSELMQFQALGGGDAPESVNEALHDALHRIAWSQNADTYRVIFLVGDAPPHMDYGDDVPYPETLAAAKRRGIRVNAIQCGTLAGTREAWQRIAQLGLGRYFQVEQGGSAVAIATPYDERLAALSAELDDTRIYYGKQEERARRREALEAERAAKAAASPAALASRAGFVASRSGASSLLGEQELVDEVVSGRVDLRELPMEELPQALADLDAEAQQAVIAEKAEARAALKGQIRALTRQRAEYLAAKVEETGQGEESLDHKIFSAVRAQAAEMGLRYDEDKPVY